MIFGVCQNVEQLRPVFWYLGLKLLYAGDGLKISKVSSLVLLAGTYYGLMVVVNTKECQVKNKHC